MLSPICRVFISNLQTEIEKQTGYRSSRKRRSESQYDYEVYHSLEEVDVKPTIYPPIPHASLLLSNLTHAQRKQTTSLRYSQSPNYPIPQVSLPQPHVLTHRHSLHFRHFAALECLFSQVDRAPASWICQALWSSRNSTHRPWEPTQIFSDLSFDPLLHCKTHTLTHMHLCEIEQTRHEAKCEHLQYAFHITLIKTAASKKY